MRHWIQFLVWFTVTALLLWLPRKFSVGLSAEANLTLSIMLFTMAVVMPMTSVLKSLAMLAVGMLIGLVGSDLETGELRLTFGIGELAEGANVLAIAVLLFLSIPLRALEIGTWPKYLAQVKAVIPNAVYRYIFPTLVLWACIELFYLELGLGGMIFAMIIAIAGYLLMKLGFEPLPILAGCVLSSFFEEKLRQVWLIHRGHLSQAVADPVAAGFLIVAVVLLVFALLPSIKKKRDEVFTE